MNRQERFYRTLDEESGGFPSPEENYLAHLKTADRLPKALRPLQHTFPWPVDMTHPSHYIACYKGDNNYVSYEHEFDEHFGIDIQLPLGTQITTPMSGIVVDAGYGRYLPDPRGMMDIEIYDPETGIDLHLAHLRPSSIPNKYMNPYKRKNRVVAIQQGDYVGDVGEFFNKTFVKIMNLKQLPNPKRISPDAFVLYERTYNHIDITIYHFPDKDNFEEDRYYGRNYQTIDPVRLFERLY